MITLMLVDDEPLANVRMGRLLSRHRGFQVKLVVGTVSEARDHLKSFTPDVVFLDIEMPGGSSFELLPHLRKSTQVVFVTAHERHAVEAFAVGAVDYLVKPVDPDRLAETLRRLEAGARKPGPVDPPGRKPAAIRGEATASRADPDRKLVVRLREAGRKSIVPLGDICWIYSLRNYTRVGMRNPKRVLVFRRRIGEWENDLASPGFVRISRSEIIQMGHVTGTEWITRNETRVHFGDSAEPLTIGRVAATKIGEILAAVDPFAG